MRQLVAAEKLARQKFEFDEDLAERKFAYDRNLHDHKRRVELAESILADFYQIGDIIRSIRFPVASAREAAGRAQAANESDDIKHQRDAYFVPIVRLTTQSEFISGFMSKRYRSRAVLGQQIDQAFSLIDSVIDDVRVYATCLMNMTYRPRREEVDDPLRRKWEAYIWDPSANDDPLEPRVGQAIAIVEETCLRIMEGKQSQ